MYEEPDTQGGFVVGALGFLAGATLAWLLVLRPAWKALISPYG